MMIKIVTKVNEVRKIVSVNNHHQEDVEK